MACEKVKMESIDGQMEGVRRMLCLETNQGDYSLLTFKDYGRESRSYTSPMFSKRDDLYLMVNYGGSSNFELSSIATSTTKVLQDTRGCEVSSLPLGSFMTWLNMQGASLTVLNLTSASSEQVACLDASTLPVFRLTCLLVRLFRQLPGFPNIADSSVYC